MKLLSLHCDYIRFKPVKKAIKEPEELSQIREQGEEVKDALVILTAVESSDTLDLAGEYAANIKDIAGQVKSKKIVLYPYAHLSSDLGKPGLALEILKKADALLQKEGFEVHRAPFGYYKEFELKCKGHPLAELSRSLGKSHEQVKIKKGKAAKIILDRRKLSENDHRILGQRLKLFTFSEEVGAGLPLWLPYGETLRNQLISFMREIEEKHGYKYVAIPMITRGALYEKTGHLPYYQDSMYAPMEIEGEDYYLKPMNCPHHHMIFKELVKSYRDLPLRLAEAGATYRNELSGVTYGLIRVKGFTQNDSHIYVTEDQLKEEFLKVLELFKEVYAVFGIQGYWFRLSLPDFSKPEKYTGDVKTWEKASRVIREAMKEFGAAFVEGKGEATFYGPKIDVQIKNAQGKEETIATSQVDLVVPERLGLVYTDKEDKKKTVIVIHRAILGSYERFIAYLLEQTKGNLPLWLAPVQVKVLSFTERNVVAARKVYEKLQEHGFRVEPDFRNASVDAKVREAELMKIPYMIVIGDKEQEAGSVAVRKRGEKKVAFEVKIEDFVSQLKKEIEGKK